MIIVTNRVPFRQLYRSGYRFKATQFNGPVSTHPTTTCRVGILSKFIISLKHGFI